MYIQTPGQISGQNPHSAGATKSTGTYDGDKILDLIMTRVPGMMEKNELELLHDLACQSNSTIVELGPAFGRSTVALCFGAQSGGVDVVTVDAFAWLLQDPEIEESALPDDLEVPTKKRLEENLGAFGLSARIIESLSWQATDQVAGPVGLLFHDADHGGETIEKDLMAWVPKLTHDAIIAFHDYEQEVYPSLKVVVDEWANRHGWHKAERAGYLQVFRKVLPMQNGLASSTLASDATTQSDASTIQRDAMPAADDTALRQETALVHEYLSAFGAHDLSACLEFFADDATLLFLSKRLVGRQQIEQWHKQRFSASVEILDIMATEAAGDTVTVEIVVTSKRLKWWKVKLQGRAIVRVVNNKIDQIVLRPSRFLK